MLLRKRMVDRLCTITRIPEVEILEYLDNNPIVEVDIKELLRDGKPFEDILTDIAHCIMD